MRHTPYRVPADPTCCCYSPYLSFGFSVPVTFPLGPMDRWKPVRQKSFILWPYTGFGVATHGPRRGGGGAGRGPGPCPEPGGGSLAGPEGPGWDAGVVGPWAGPPGAGEGVAVGVCTLNRGDHTGPPECCWRCWWGGGGQHGARLTLVDGLQHQDNVTKGPKAKLELLTWDGTGTCIH